MGLSRQARKTFDAKLATLTTQIGRRWKKYQSTVKYPFSITFLSTSLRPLRTPRCCPWRCQLHGLTVLWLFGSICGVHFLCHPPMLPQKATGKIWKNDIFTIRLYFFVVSDFFTLPGKKRCFNSSFIPGLTLYHGGRVGTWGGRELLEIFFEG